MTTKKTKEERITKMKTLEVKINFFEGILGTSPNNEDIYRDFIIERAKANGADIDELSEQEEVDALPLDEEIEKGMTVFPRDEDGNPFLYDYQLKGYFKDTCSMLRKVKGTKSSGVKAFKKEIDGLVFPNPRQIVFQNAKLGVCQRPLRASTAQGERVALAMSEEIAAGAYIVCEITCLIDDQIDLIREWLDYGKLRGIGQWRNSGKGRFTWEELRCY